MIPLGPITNAGPATDAVDIAMMGIVLGVIAIAIGVDLMALFGGSATDGGDGADDGRRRRV